MVHEIGFYSHGPQAGYIGWIRTSAGIYFINTDGIMSQLY